MPRITEVAYDGTTTVVQPATPEEINAETMMNQIAGAIVANRTYYNITNPTTAQTTAQVKALSRQMNRVLRFLAQQFDSTD